MVSSGLTLYESMNMYPLRLPAGCVPNQGNRQRLLSKKDLYLFTGICCSLATYSDVQVHTQSFKKKFLRERIWSIWESLVAGSLPSENSVL